jgi:YfiH family protein
LGFTEYGFELEDLAELFKEGQMLELKQVHSDIIHFSGEIGPLTEGDGIILTLKNRIAVIKTADCVPLFFWHENYSIGGIIHAGWQGFYKGIESKLLKLLAEKAVKLEHLYFYMGPSIEKNCYEVGRDLYEKFSGKDYRDEIFFKKNKEKFLMDIKRGIYLSLKKSGIRDERIMATNLCTYCETSRFPSYRRDKKTGNRIFNFLYLKPRSKKKICSKYFIHS